MSGIEIFLIQRFELKGASETMARVRSSKQTKQAAQVRAVDFKHLWRQLRAVGWKSKRPRGLATVWTYYSPGAGSEPHAEGVNVFTGKCGFEIGSWNQ